MYEVTLSPSAAKFYSEAERSLASKLARCFEALAEDPRKGNNVKRLRGEFDGYLRHRVGDHRVVYRIDDAELKVFVAVIAHRRDVYE